MIVDNAPGIGHEMQCIFAWVAYQDDSGEGIIAARTALGALPLVTATPDAALLARPLAAAVGREAGFTVRLVRFTQRTEIEVIEP